VDGRLLRTLRGDTIVSDFKVILNEYIDRRYGQPGGNVALAEQLVEIS
jgi:(E)-4-hydroxy-3-methylbut-2-enyl-diphosphate synthase